MHHAYLKLHQQSYAHSIEVRDQQNQLLGGLYGVALSPIFFGESMFSNVTDASKVSLLALVRHLQANAYQIIDCQVESDHLNSLGASNLSRREFESFLAQTDPGTHPRGAWSLDIDAGELL